MSNQKLGKNEVSFLERGIADAISKCGAISDAVEPFDQSISSYFEFRFEVGFRIRIKKCHCFGYRCDCQSLNGSTRKKIEASLGAEMAYHLQQLGFTERSEPVDEDGGAVFIRGESKRKVMINLCPSWGDYPVNSVWIFIAPV